MESVCNVDYESAFDLLLHRYIYLLVWEGWVDTRINIHSASNFFFHSLSKTKLSPPVLFRQTFVENRKVRLIFNRGEAWNETEAIVCPKSINFRQSCDWNLSLHACPGDKVCLPTKRIRRNCVLKGHKTLVNESKKLSNFSFDENLIIQNITVMHLFLYNSPT